MSVKVRPYVNGGWEVDIRFRLPDGTVFRERTKNPMTGKSAVVRWGEARERELLLNGKPRRQTAGEEVAAVPMLKEFAPRFIDGYAQCLSEIRWSCRQTIVSRHGPSTECVCKRRGHFRTGCRTARGLVRARRLAVTQPRMSAWPRCTI